MKLLNVKGPYTVPLKKVKKRHFDGKEIDFDMLDSFWSENGCAEQKGCYIFVNEVGRGSTPIYVGQTKKFFSKECFESHKILKLKDFLADAGKANLKLYFIVWPDCKVESKILDEIETYLILQAKNANSNLLNDRKTEPKWTIQGIAGKNSAGKPEKSVQNLKKCLNMK